MKRIQEDVVELDAKDIATAINNFVIQNRLLASGSVSGVKIFWKNGSVCALVGPERPDGGEPIQPRVYTNQGS